MSRKYSFSNYRAPFLGTAMLLGTYFGKITRISRPFEGSEAVSSGLSSLAVKYQSQPRPWQRAPASKILRRLS
jgi:hypothetical protein